MWLSAAGAQSAWLRQLASCMPMCTTWIPCTHADGCESNLYLPLIKPGCSCVCLQLRVSGLTRVLAGRYSTRQRCWVDYSVTLRQCIH